jgi:spermidine synthase
MTEQETNESTDPAAAGRFLPLLLLLFIGSGCAALIYEIVWFQLLQLVIGSSAVSLGVLLGTFMGGMCLGSVVLPRVISAQRHPLRVYAFLELGIGILGIVALFLVPFIARLYVANAAQGFPGILLRGVVCAICLLPPTLLMGATLPAIARWIETTPQGVSWLGFFYGGNIAGAVFGCLLAGFYLLRVHDMATATYVAAAINAAVALIGFALAGKTTHELKQTLSPGSSRREENQIPKMGRHEANEPERGCVGVGDQPQRADSNQSLLTSAATKEGVKSAQARVEGPASSWPVYVAIALSGMCALGAEVVWTRLLSLLLGGTVYTFSIILAVFLVGLGIGSSVGSLVARGTGRSRMALGCCQLLLGAAIAWSAFMLARSLPYWPIKPSLSLSPWLTFQLDLVRCFWAILPATILWGASFPLALAAAATRGQDAGRLVGGIYAANTVGAIIGAIGSSMLLVGWVGTQHAHQLVIALSGVAALLMFIPPDWLRRRSASEEPEGPPGAERGDSNSVLQPNIAGPFFAIASIGLAAWLAWNVPQVPWGLVAHGRNLATQDGDGKILYMGEGMNASVAVTELTSGVRNFHVSGKIEASSEPQDMRLQRMLGHIPALLHPNPRSVLIVGCGAGVTAGSFVVHPSIERIVICEIEPLIPRVVADFFGNENYNVVKDPRVQVVYDDARHYVLTTKDKFDIITSDPIHPWVKGAATLYTKEYFELCRRHLNPGGVVTQWVPLYESNFAVVKSEIATFFDVFPNGTIWSNDQAGEGYDVVLLGQVDAMKIDVDQLQQRLARDKRVAQSLEDVGFKSALSLLATYAGQGSDLKTWLRDAEINLDRNLRLQYLAGMGVNSNQGASIYDEMLANRTFPEELFVFSAEHREALKKALEPPP